MEFEYISHAEESLAERRLPKSLVEDAVRRPDAVLPGRFGRKIAQKQIGNKLLRVVYEERGNVYIVVTAYYTELERYL